MNWESCQESSTMITRIQVLLMLQYVTKMTIAVAPHSILCELQPATVKETFIEQDTEEEQNYENITVDTNTLTEEQLGGLKNY